jgi:hypothetical protein
MNCVMTDEHGGRTEVAEQADDVIADHRGGAALLHGARGRDHGADKEDGVPVDAAIDLRQAHDAGDHREACADETCDRRRRDVEDQEHDQERQDREHALGAPAERHGLGADLVGRVDDQELGAGEVALQRRPAALQQQVIARAQREPRANELGAAALHRQHHHLMVLAGHAGEDRAADQRRPLGDDDFGQPGVAREQDVAQRRFVAVLAHLELQVGGEPLDLVAVATDEEQVAGLEPVALERSVIRVIEEGDSAHTGVCGDVDGLARLTDERRAGGHRQLVQPVLEIVVLHKRVGVTAEVGRDRLARPFGEHPLAEQEDDDDRPDELRYAEHGPGEEADVAGAILLRLRGGDDVDRRAEQGELGTLQASERKRDHQLRRSDPGADRDDDGHRQ